MRISLLTVLSGVLLGIPLGASAVVAEITVDTRYQVLRARADEVVRTAAVGQRGESFEWHIATRMNLAWATLTALDYAAEGTYSPLSWISITGRFVQINRFGDPSATTSFFGRLSLQYRAPRFLSYFFSLGAFRRFHRVPGNSVLPIFAPSFTEGDLSVALGLAIHPNETWYVRGQVATFEFLDVNNLNNPFAEIATVFEPSHGRWTATAYVRYQLLLGFGLYDALVGGVGFRVPLVNRS